MTIRRELSMRTVEVETPEQVTLGFELADLGSRFMALVADVAVLILLMSGVGGLAAWAQVASGGGVAFGNWSMAVFTMVAFSFFWGYFTLFEGLRDGQTPGKKLVGLRVIHDGGYPLTMRGAAIRNLVRVIDVQPGVSCLVGGGVMMAHPLTKRLGDLAAGTIVVRDRGEGEIPEASGLGADALGPPRLDDERFDALDRYVARREELESGAHARLTARLAELLADELGETDPGLTEEERLLLLHEDESLRRAAGGGGGRGSRQAVMLVRRQRDRWREYEALVDLGRRKGLPSFGEARLSRFAELYRTVAADLARVRTYGGSGELAYTLERMVQSGHNLFYRAEGRSWRAIRDWLRVGFPTLVRLRFGFVALAAALLIGPGAVTYALVRVDPGVARTLLPAAMVQRADMAPERLAAGEQYVDVPEVFMPVMSSQIIANNIQVTFLVFAGGIFAGLGSMALLVFNGIFFGAVTGLYDARGAGALIWTFVAPHGVIELMAIFIAGGAGLWMGSALVAPGVRTRSEALGVRAREAVSLLAGTTLLLVLAGLVEGFVSPAPIPAAVRLGIAGVVALAFALYLAGAGRKGEGLEMIERARALPGRAAGYGPPREDPGTSRPDSG